MAVFTIHCYLLLGGTRFRIPAFPIPLPATLLIAVRRYREGRRISTGFAESAVNEIVAKRMTKSQQMRWNRYTVQLFLDVRVHVLNGTLEEAFRRWHKGFRPLPAQSNSAAVA